MIHKALITSILLIICQLSFAQFGISTEFRTYPVTDWEKKLDNNVFDANYGLSLDYWMRLKNYRWEMMPTLSASFSPAKNTEFLGNSDVSLLTGRVQFKNNFYILDFENDCNCPTFSKQSGWFKKSFYLQLAPAYGFNRVNFDLGGVESLKNDFHLFELGIGAGFDFGFSDLITLSPYINYVVTNRFDYALFATEGQDFKTTLSHIAVGLRLGLRPDYARPSYRRRKNLRY